jgi:hypothetical protein
LIKMSSSMMAIIREAVFFISVAAFFAGAIMLVNYVFSPRDRSPSSVVENMTLCPEGGGPCITTDGTPEKKHGRRDTPRRPYNGEQKL